MVSPYLQNWYRSGVSETGGLFLFGVYGKRPTRETAALLRDTGAAGVLLLSRNIETAAQTRDFTEELVQRLGRPLLFAVDHEGGWVLRFKSGVTAFPGNAALGRAGRGDLARETGRQMALELARLGIALNLAPVLDVVTERYNPGIGIRSFGKDPRLVSRLGAAMIRGMQERGVAACAKHFPGKGAATVDAHVSLPTIRLSRRAFERVHLAPFRAAVKAGVACVMTSHVRFPALDSRPATFSRRITERLLRGRLGFRGVVVSDDLCMGAVTGSRPAAFAAVDALKAGHDLLIVAHDPQAQRDAAKAVERAFEEGDLDRDAVRRSLARVRGLMDRKASARPHSPKSGAALSRRVARSALETVQQGTLKLPLSANGRPPLVLVPDFEEVRDRFTFEGGPRGPESLVRRLVAKWGPARLRRTPVERTELGGLAAEVRMAPRVLFFCFEAMRFPGQRAALELLEREAHEKTAVCLIRNPWDRELLRPGMTAVDAAGYRLCQLEAALESMLA